MTPRKGERREEEERGKSVFTPVVKGAEAVCVSACVCLQLCALKAAQDDDQRKVDSI